MISFDVSAMSNNDRNLTHDKKQFSIMREYNKIYDRNAKSAIFPPINNRDNNKKEKKRS